MSDRLTAYARRLLVKACLNGPRKQGEHPALPLTPAELAADARRVVTAGAGAIHVHPRGPDGAETLDPAACDAALMAIRRACPGVPVGLSTAAWIEPDPDRRLSLIGSWTERPDFVSVNFSEPGAVEICEHLPRLGIGIEAGTWTVADAEALAASGLARHVVRVLVEPPDPEPVSARAAAVAIGAALDRDDIEAPRVYHGLGMATWPVIELGLEDGWDVRVGLEDTLHLQDGSPAPGNAELVAAVVAMARRRGRLPPLPQ
jgi:uncharacterized protein (DUF849 family)